MTPSATTQILALQAWVRRFPTKDAAARAFGISPAYLGQLLSGTRACSTAVLDRLGLERVVTVRKKQRMQMDRKNTRGNNVDD